MKKLIFALIITNPYNSFSNDNSELSLYCNFKFSEYKSINTELPKNAIPNPEKICTKWKCSETIEIKLSKMQDKTVSLSNGIVKNKNIDEFNKSEEKIFINTPIIDNSFISIQYSINTRNGDASKEIREFDYLTLMQNSETNNKEKINPPKDTDPSILGIYFFNGKCLKKPDKNF